MNKILEESKRIQDAVASIEGKHTCILDTGVACMACAIWDGYAEGSRSRWSRETKALELAIEGLKNVDCGPHCNTASCSLGCPAIRAELLIKKINRILEGKAEGAVE